MLSDRSKSVFGGAVSTLLPFVHPQYLENYSTGNVRQNEDKINLLHLAGDALPDELIVDINPMTLEQLVKELEQIRAEAHAADVEPDVKRLIENSIGTLIAILMRYKELGPDGAARLYGSVAAELHRVARHSPPSSPSGKTALQKMLAGAKKVGAAVIFAGATVTGADALLTHGEHIIGFVTDDATPPDEEIVLPDQP